MKPLCFDLETIANKALIQHLPEIKPKANLTDPKKIEKDIAEKKEKQIEEMGLDPLFNRICCAGFYDPAISTAGSFMLQSEDEDGERELLCSFWDIASDYDHFVTFNGRAFDIRCLLLHSMRVGVRPTVDIDFGRYNRGNHTDMRLILAGESQFAKGKLDTFCKVFGVGQKTEGVDGALVQSLWEIGDKETIQVYCEQDTKILWDLTELAHNTGLVNINYTKGRKAS